MRYGLIAKTGGLVIVLSLFIYPLAGCTDQHEVKTSAPQQRFSDIEKWVKLFEDPARDQWQKPGEVVKALRLKHGDVIADIGAGTGYFTRRFAIAVGPEGKALGLDIESSMIQYMKEDAERLNMKNYEARVVKPNDPELEASSVDVVFLCNTYHHIETRVAYFKNVSKSLKKNGRLVVVDFYRDNDFGPPRHHKLAKDVVLREIKQAGYRLIRSHDILPYQYFLEFGLEI